MRVNMEETHFSAPPHDPRSDIRTKNWHLLRAIETKNIAQVSALLDGYKNEQIYGDISKIVNFKQGMLGTSPITLAAYLKNTEIVELLVQHGGLINIKDKLGRTVLHYAARTGSEELTAYALSQGAEVNAKIHATTWIHKGASEISGDIAPMPSIWGRTPLHVATAGLHLECVKTLLQHGASVQCLDELGLPPLLTISEAEAPRSSQLMLNYETIISLFIDHKCDVNATHPVTGRNVLFQAIEFGSVRATRTLLEHGINVFHTDSSGTSVLHAAARSPKSDVLIEVLNRCQEMINSKNKDGDAPMHYAAYAGSRDSLRLLLDKGGDLSQTNALGLSVTDAIFSFLPRPTSFIIETLDTQFIPNEYSINEKLFNVTLDFRILSPSDNDRQMSVIVALMNSVTFAQKSKIMLHPLIEAFVRLKWVRLRAFFFVLVLTHFLYVLSLSLYISCIVMDKFETTLVWSNPILLTTASVILINLVCQTVLEPRRFFEYETWLTVTSLVLSLSIAGWHCVSEKHPTKPEWLRHIASYDILLTWTQLMFLIGKYPFKGHFTLMFYTVFRNVLKLMIFYACLVIGFSLSFCLQFHSPQFANPWLSFVRTTVMLMGEYDYTDLFRNEPKYKARFEGDRGYLFFTSRCIFLVFVFIGSIVLLNLMTGLAVNDIQSLQTEGNLRHMIKQAEFLSHVENILSRRIFFLPERIINERKRIPTKFRINPSAENRFCESKYKTKSTIPFRLLESIVLLAVKNQKEVFKKESEVILLKDGISVCTSDNQDKQVIIDALADIKTELRILAMRLNTVINSEEEPDHRQSNNTHNHRHFSRTSNSSVFSFRLKRMKSNRARVV